ncbi:bifunctional helix-turn-helix transcriptional regulator/GNAT family N-acetyltransferase [Candidatus Solirubrobacter pratensis]|uniref:bifunctional helix-turn-helix transcriptional regulator/GNAT family N-acetyltransferase n=1 Tax=Candidatus Solirubrobacter pratensis TaxID=1298857 RepID=UPI00040F6D59|nr:bifunctional helix-turn-helix transcriptional regulator/GNAT family N-acetyltransferase [Candidatus Solirubrobacter pratensis]
MSTVEQIDAVRSFNRFYTRRLGLVRGGLVRTPHPLAEARVLYELGHHEALETSALRDALDVDAGQLSRLLTRLESAGLLARERSEGDARRRLIRLTPAGAEAFATLDRRTVEQVGRLLDDLGDVRRARLVSALAEVRAALQDPGPRTVSIRDRLEPGDLGWMVSRHGALYAREYGWDASFETLVAGIAAAFDPERDKAWIAEVDGRRAGCVLCVHHDELTAKLRTLLVEPDARGLGLGGRLVDEVIRHARARGYAELTLWTNDVLTAARRIYERAGFTLTGESPHRAFGHDLVEQTWSLTL